MGFYLSLYWDNVTCYSRLPQRGHKEPDSSCVKDSVFSTAFVLLLCLMYLMAFPLSFCSVTLPKKRLSLLIILVLWQFFFPSILPFLAFISLSSPLYFSFLIFLSVNRMVVEGSLFSFIYPKLKVLSIFALTQIVPNPYGFLSLKFWRVVLISLFSAITMNEDWSFQASKRIQKHNTAQFP